MVAQVGYSVAGRLRGRVTPCVICTWHVETRSAGFLIEPQNQGRRFVSCLASTTWTVSSGLTSKPVATVFSSLVSKLVAIVSPGLASKPAVGFLVEPQNQGCGGFSGLGLKTGNSGLVIWVSKSPQRFLGLGIKIKQVSVCRLRHKTDGGGSARDTHRDLAACLAWKQVWLGFPSLA
jgi:hypothetical protein